MVKRHIAVMCAAMLAVSGALVVTAASATASTNRNSAHGIVVTSARDRITHHNRKVTITPHVSVAHGHKIAIHSVTAAAYKHGHRVASGRSVHLRAGTYKMKTSVTYRYYHSTNKTRTVRTAHDPDDGLPGDAKCVISTEDASGYPNGGWCTSAAYHHERVYERGTDNWCPSEDPSLWTIGATVHNFCAEFGPYYTYSTQRYTAHTYGRYRHWSTPRRTITVRNRRGGGSSSSSAGCTTTSTGSCIRGGEFCPQADYGSHGTDVNGRVWECTGNRTHPHWE